MIAERTLLLNSSYEPLDVVSWEHAIILWCRGKVEVIAEHDRFIRSVTVKIKVPSIVRLLTYVRSRRKVDAVRFTRANIYGRDGHRCQYCGATMATEELTFDHVIPATQGGRKGWENIVSACIDCNRRKGSRTPEEAGMRLLRQPRKPHAVAAMCFTVGLKRTPEAWRGFLYWNSNLEMS